MVPEARRGEGRGGCAPGPGPRLPAPRIATLLALAGSLVMQLVQHFKGASSIPRNHEYGGALAPPDCPVVESIPRARLGRHLAMGTRISNWP